MVQGIEKSLELRWRNFVDFGTNLPTVVVIAVNVQDLLALDTQHSDITATTVSQGFSSHGLVRIRNRLPRENTFRQA